jgi:single-strand DNA-binding protein
MNETYVTIRGRLCADPTARTTRTGSPMATFRVASSVRRPVQGQPGVWEDAGTTFYDVVTYKALAANVGMSLRKGHPVSVHGRQHVNSFRKEDGSTWWAVEVVADAVGHDLSYGTTAFSRVGRGQEGDGFRAGVAGGPEGGEPGATPDPYASVTARWEGGLPPDLGDPDTDPYVVEAPPGRGLGQVEAGGPRAEPGTDTGPLVPTGDEAAA